MVNVEMTNAPNLEYVPNVEMTNAVVNNARNANNLARNEAVRRSRAEAVLAKEELKAKKAKEAANKANVNARNAAANAKKLAANAIVKNVENKLKVIQNGPGSKENKNKMGRSIYLKATKKVHPNSGGNQVSFVKLGNIYNKFKNFTGTKVTAGFNETWTA